MCMYLESSLTEQPDGMADHGNRMPPAVYLQNVIVQALDTDLHFGRSQPPDSNDFFLIKMIGARFDH